MAQISSGVGLISGIDTGSIIKQLIAIDSQPVTLLKSRITKNTAQEQAYSGMLTQLQSLQTIGQAFQRPLTFAATSATSSDTNVLTASTTDGATVGSFQFQVARLVTSQQSITDGFAGPKTLPGAGNITIGLGGGDLQSPTLLSQLNGGTGIPQGQFRITDRAGHSTVVDATAAVTLDDIVQKINNSLDVSVKATVANDHLVLTDTSGQTVGNLIVQDLAGGQTALGLGLAGNSATGAITGTSINYLGLNTALASLNDGLGVSTASGAADFQVTLGDGSAVAVTLGGAGTIGDAVSAINTAGGTKLKAAVDPANNSLTLTDTSGGAGAFTVTALNNSQAAHDLGIDKTGSGGAIQGSTLLAGIDTVLVSSLKGGSGIALGTIAITNRNGTTTNVDLAGAKGVQDILDKINNTVGVGVAASLNAAGDGIQLKDTTSGTGNLVIADVNSTTAAALGLAGTFTTAQAAAVGGHLHMKYVAQSSLLSKYNGGQGVALGAFTITNAAGATATVDLSSGTFKTLGDVISAINAKSLGVTASINANGNGLLVTDTTAGAGHLTVKDSGSKTAADLNIASVATGNTIDGAFEKTIAVSATNTIADVQAMIQKLGWGVGANLVDDGSGLNSMHLAFTALNSGRAGRVVIDGGATRINAHTLVQAQDAAVFLGGGTGGQSQLITSSSNQVAGVLPGVTLSLVGVSSKGPVTLNVTRDPSNLVTQMQSFTKTFNAVVTTLATDTKFDTTTNQAGLLMGESTARQIQSDIYTAMTSVVKGAGPYQTLADIGLTVGDKGALTFDDKKFQAAYAAHPDAVQNLFTQVKTGFGTVINDSMTRLVDPVNGAIPLQNKTIDQKNLDFQTEITTLNQIIANKQTQLERQFAHMEQILAGLQNQQQALGSLTGLTSAASRSSSSGSSSSSSGSSSSSSSGTSTG